MLALLKVIALAIPFSLLIVAGNLFFPYITGKALVFRFFVEGGLVVTALVLLFLKFSFGGVRKNPIVITVGVYFLALILATLFSVNPYRSFWGNAERMEGLWGMMHYFGYFVIFLVLFSLDRRFLVWSAFPFLAIGLIEAAVGVRQFFFLGLPQAHGTLGNPSYFGTYGLLFGFLSFMVASSGEVVHRDFQKLWKVIFSCLAIVGFGMIFIAQTRSAMVGLVIGLTAAAVAWVLQYGLRVERLRRWVVWGIPFGVVTAAVLLYLFLRLPIAQEIPGVNRLAAVIRGGDTTTITRLIVWKFFSRSIVERPFFGWGLENSPVAFFKHLDPNLFTFEEAIFDRPHNKYIETGVTSGLLGLLAYCALLVSLGGGIRRSFFAQRPHVDKKTHAATHSPPSFSGVSQVGFFSAYLANNFFLFDFHASFLIFFWFAAVLVYFEKTESHAKALPQHRVLRDGRSAPALAAVGYVGVVAASLLFVIGSVVNVQHFTVLRQMIDANKLQPEQAFQLFADVFERGGPYQTEVALFWNSYFTGHLMQLHLGHLQEYLSVVKEAHGREPTDLRLSLALAANLQRRAQFDLEKEKYIKEAETFLRKELEMYPNFPEYSFQLATFLANEDRAGEALEILHRLETKMPSSRRLAWHLAYAHLYNKQPAEALQAFEDALARGYGPANFREALVIVKIYLANGMRQEAERVAVEILSQSAQRSKQGDPIALQEHEHLKDRAAQLFSSYGFSFSAPQ